MDKIIGTCEICGAPIYESQSYRKLPFQKNKYVHKQCENIRRAKALALGAWLKG